MGTSLFSEWFLQLYESSDKVLCGMFLGIAGGVERLSDYFHVQT